MTGNNGKLERISIGGLENLSNFSGDEQNYSMFGNVDVTSSFRGNNIKYGSPWTFNTFPSSHDPKDKESFLSAVNKNLEDNDWYLINCQVTHKGMFTIKYKIEGTLYSKKSAENKSTN